MLCISVYLYINRHIIETRQRRIQLRFCHVYLLTVARQPSRRCHLVWVETARPAVFNGWRGSRKRKKLLLNFVIINCPGRRCAVVPRPVRMRYGLPADVLCCKTTEILNSFYSTSSVSRRHVFITQRQRVIHEI